MKCPLCPWEGSDLAGHILEKHSVPKASPEVLFPRKCGICEKMLHSPAEVRKHLDEHLMQEWPRVLEALPKSPQELYKGWEIREIEHPTERGLWVWMRWEGKKGRLAVTAPTLEDLKKYIDEREEYELKLRMYPAVAEEEISLDVRYIKAALERMVGFYPEEMRVEVEGKPPHFVHKGPRDAWVIGWWMTPPLPTERATFRSDPVAMAREIMGLVPKRVVLIGPATRLEI